MSERRIVVVGVGSIGSRHIDTLLAAGECDLVGVDLNPSPNDERLPIVTNFEDLGPWRPTHALICSPPALHYEHAIYFLKQGIPTFIEKPMTQYSCEAEALNVCAKESGAYIGVGYMERAHHVVASAKEFFDKFGCRVAVITCYWRSTQKTYMQNVVAESSHAIDLAGYLLGPICTVKRESFGDEVVVYTYHYSGAVCSIFMNMNKDPLRSIFMRFDNEHVFEVAYGNTRDEWDKCYSAELEAFLSGAPLCTGEDGAQVVEVLEEVK